VAEVCVARVADRQVSQLYTCIVSGSNSALNVSPQRSICLSVHVVTGRESDVLAYSWRARLNVYVLRVQSVHNLTSYVATFAHDDSASVRRRPKSYVVQAKKRKKVKTQCRTEEGLRGVRTPPIGVWFKKTCQKASKYGIFNKKYKKFMRRGHGALPRPFPHWGGGWGGWSCNTSPARRQHLQHHRRRRQQQQHQQLGVASVPNWVAPREGC